MDRMRELGGTKKEVTSPVKETRSTPNQVEVINIEDDIAQDKKKRYKIEGSSVDQADCFAKVSVQSLHEENMKLLQLVSEIKNAKNTEILPKLLEDRTKYVENLVELERIREANKVLVKEDRDVKVKKPEIQKTDVERKRPAEKKLELQKKDGREKACSL
ncbi:uncharacterized protein [Malus domestica]|uniref:uncharacterized protein n=1 Tax=Malus domestica TaxID=3750 RepID=UPI000498C5F8